jgi:acyl dehydratase
MGAEPMLLLWEDLNPGDEYWTPSRTMTEADLVWFCSWTGDWLPIHSDEEFAKQSEFGTRIFHGQAGYAVATGLVSRSGLHNGAIVVLEATLKYKAPLRVGDTIRVRSRVTDKRPTKKLDRGIIWYDVAIVNQKDEVITEGPWTFLVRRKTES